MTPWQRFVHGKVQRGHRGVRRWQWATSATTRKGRLRDEDWGHRGTRNVAYMLPGGRMAAGEV
jgi:hypothetical protein